MGTLTLTSHLGQNVGLGVGSITNRFLGKWARTHPPKGRLDTCNFLCWFKPIMLPHADFRLAKIVAEIITTKQKVLPWSITWRSDFDVLETLGEILESEGTNVLFDCFLWTFLLMIVVGEILHLQGSFQGALGLDNCVRYRFNRPRLYLTEEHSIRWKFCLVNQKLFHLIWSASKNQSVQTHRRRNQYSKIKEN